MGPRQTILKDNFKLLVIILTDNLKQTKTVRTGLIGSLVFVLLGYNIVSGS